MDCLKCSSCDDANERLYSCESCLADSEECSNESAKELFCDLCVASHVKKGHDVRTAKGQVPLICEKHKMLHSLHCKTCDVTFCAKCISNHSKHEIGSSAQRACELRKELFKILTKSEKNEKPLRVKKESVIAQKVRHSREQDKLKATFIKEVTKLQKAGLSMIENNYKVFEEKEKTVMDAIEEVVDLQQKTRSILSLDDCQMIRDVKKLRETSVKCEQNSRYILDYKFQCESCDISVVEREFQGCSIKLKQKLQSKLGLPAVKKVELLPGEEVEDWTHHDYVESDKSDESESDESEQDGPFFE